ncbi:MAG: alpha/beta fold hydrolase [Bacillota bacterium]
MGPGLPISNAHELTLYLKERFNSGKIYLVGHSWGSHLGLHLAKKSPQDYHAYIAISGD